MGSHRWDSKVVVEPTFHQINIMSWDKYVSDQLLATGNVQKGAICGLDGSIWAVSEKWEVTGQEAKDLASAFKDPSILHQKGIVVAGEKYMFLSATEDVLRGKKQVWQLSLATTQILFNLVSVQPQLKPLETILR